MKRNLIIDTDPGHDDVLAILTAVANQEELNILGITTVCGNQTLAKVTDNILKVQDFIGTDFPVAMGSDRPLVKPVDVQPQAHGDTGLDGPSFPTTTRKPLDIPAVEFMRQMCEENDKITFLCIGPLTNMALFLRSYPKLAKEKIECIAIMGGGIYNGNIQTKAEFNIYHDPEAAHMVFNSDVPVIMAPLEICYAASMYLNELPRFNNGKKVSQLVYEILDFYKGYAVRRGWDSMAIFDMVPLIYLLHPEYFVTQTMSVDVELNGVHTQGMTVCDTRRTPEHLNDVIVLTDCDRDKVVQVFFDAVDYLDSIVK